MSRRGSDGEAAARGVTEAARDVCSYFREPLSSLPSFLPFLSLSLSLSLSHFLFWAEELGFSAAAMGQPVLQPASNAALPPRPPSFELTPALGRSGLGGARRAGGRRA